MEGKTLSLAIARGFQLLFAAVVLGTSVTASKFFSRAEALCKLEKQPNCDFHGLIPSLQFGIFVGAVGLLDAIVGIVAVFMDVIPYIVNLGCDGAAALANLAGGIAISVVLASFDRLGSNSHITETKADAAFQFLFFLLTLVLIGLGFIWQRGSGKMHSAV